MGYGVGPAADRTTLAVEHSSSGVEVGIWAREAAACFEVSAPATLKPVQRARETGGTTLAKIGGCCKPVPAGHEDLLHEDIAAKPGIALVEAWDALIQRGVGRPLTTTWSTLRQLDPRQKNPESRRSESAGCRHPPKTLASMEALDGPGALHVPRQNRGCDQPGQALRMGSHERVPGRCRTPRPTIVIAGLRSLGVVAPPVLEGSMTGETFLAYVEQFLVPVLSLDHHPRHC
jgi:hypothetical protein